MTLDAAHELATALMRRHKLHGWCFAFDKAWRRFGCCSHRRRTITLSAVLVELNAEAEVRDTMLHEIAHALCDPREGHGWRWRWLAKSIGARPERCYHHTAVRRPTGNWIGICECGYTTSPRLRRRKLACKRCCDEKNGGRYHENYRLAWIPEPAGAVSVSAIAPQATT